MSRCVIPVSYTHLLLLQHRLFIVFLAKARHHDIQIFLLILWIKLCIRDSNISHAQKITKLYQEHGVKAIAIDSKTPATERQQDIEAFKKGDIQEMCIRDRFR